MNHWVFLNTDLLFYLLLFLIGLYFSLVYRQEHLRRIWRTIFVKPIAWISCGVIILYLSIAILDSMHFTLKEEVRGLKPDPYRVYSVLDLILAPLPSVDEKTYAAPLALHSYQKEWQLNEQGEMQFSYVPLSYAPDLIAEARSEFSDLMHRLLWGGVCGLAFALTLMFMLETLLQIGHAIKRIFKKQPILIRPLFFWPRSSSKIVWFVLSLMLCFAVGAVLVLSKAYHVMGTDKIGQDVFLIAVKSIRTAILLGSLTSLMVLPLAILAAIPAGYWGGFVDDIVQFIYVTLSSIPGVLLIAASILAMQVYISVHPDLFPTSLARADARLLTLCAILGLTSWTNLCRILRAETLKLRETDFVLAAKAMGHRSLHIMARHILPNVSHLILITVVLDFSSLVMAEAVLTYIGVGVDPNMNSWGNMIAAARLELAREPVVWWPLMASFTLMFIFILSVNLFSDQVRKGFSPREEKV